MSGMLWLCYTVSGAAALMLELLWMRSAALVLGGTARTTAAVLGCYFAGLAFGAAAGARSTDQPARRYALLELAATGGAVWSVVVFASLRTDAAQRVLASWPGSGVVALAIAILPTTLCLGATLPAIGQALAPRGTVRWRAPLLYTLNTAGAMLGIAAAGFGLPGAIGVRASYGVAAALSASAGLVAFSVAHAADSGAVAAPFSESPRASVGPVDHIEGDVSRNRLYVAAASSGALGMGLEVLWVRFFAQVLHNSVYSFTAVTLVVVAGLALGGAAAALLLRRFAAHTVASAALAACAVATISGFWVFVRYTDGLAYFGMRTGLGEYIGRILLLTAATAGPAAVTSGVVLPAFWAVWGDADGAARPLGSLAAANTLGGAAGALAIGFLIVPTIGMRTGILLITLAYVVTAELLGSGTAVRTIGAAIVLLAAFADPLRAPIVHLRGSSESVRDILEGPSGIVSVVDGDGDLQLRLDNYYVLGGSAAAANERRLGLVPLLLHPAPRTAAFIGLATGITASAAAALEVPDVRVVELVPEVASAARTHFAAWNGSLLERPNVHLVIDDGRRYLQATSEQFDVVVADLFIPWHAGTTSLYAREMYETMARRLAPGGLFCQWLPLYQLTREEFDVIVHTFLEVFPQAQLWRADFYPDRPVVGLVGRLAPAQVDLDGVGARLVALPDWSRDAFLASPLALAMLYGGDLRGDAAAVADATLNSDDRPRLEFLAPRLTRIGADGDKDWFTGEALASYLDELASRTGEMEAIRSDGAAVGASEPILPATEATHAARRAGRVLYRYALAAVHHDPSASQLADEVRRLAPEVVLASEGAGNELADTRRDLADLRTEQEHVRRQLESMEHHLETLAGGQP